MEMCSKYTLITGGSEGIGFELAKIFAGNNKNLVIAARHMERLEEVKSELESRYNIDVKIICADLSSNEGYEGIVKFIEEENIIVDNLVNNAGIGSFGYFHEGDDGFEDKIININITSLTKLTKYFLKDMVKRREGGILNVASTAAFCAGPKMGLYYSTKAYVLSLTEAIYEEVNEYGIRVSCLCPGPVKTSFQEKSGIKKSEAAQKYLMDAGTVAKIGYENFLKGKVIIIPGIKNKLLVIGSRFMPRKFIRKIILKNNIDA